MSEEPKVDTPPENPPQPKLPEPPPFVPYTKESIQGYIKDLGMPQSQEGQYLNLVNDHKLTPETLKALTAFGVNNQQALSEAQDAKFKEQLTAWQTALKEDAVLKEGDGFEANVKKVTQLLADYGGEKGENNLNAVQAKLNETGLALYPDFVKMMIKIADALPKEGKPVQSGQSRSYLNAAKILFPDSK